MIGDQKETYSPEERWASDDQPDQKYQDLLSQVNDIVFRMSIEGVLTEVSPSVKAILGYTADEVIGKDITTYIPPRSITIIRKEIAKKIAKPEITSRYEIPIRSRSGKIVICEVNSRLIRRNGSPLEIFGIIRDTTERRRIENALITSEKKYRKIFENAVEGMFRTTPDGRILDANHSFARILGYSSPDELIREVPDIQKMYKDPAEREHLLRKLKDTGIIEGITLEIHDRGSIGRWIRLNARQVWEGTHEVIEGTCMDITREELLRRSLKEKDHIYRLLAENISDVIWTSDLAMNITYMSPSVRRLRGFSPEEAVSQPLQEVYTPDSYHTMISSCKSRIEEFRNGGTDADIPLYLELGMYHRDGHVIWTETVISLIFNEAHRPAGIVGSIRDISARKQVEQAHRESEERLREAQKLAQVGNWEMEDRSRIIICSDEVYRIIGIEDTSEPLTYEQLLGFIHPDDRQNVQLEFLRSIQENKEFEMLFRIQASGGGIKHLHVRGKRGSTQDGMADRTIGSIQDITSRMILEEEREKLMNQIQKNIAELTILNDGIRNPLAIIETILDDEPFNNDPDALTGAWGDADKTDLFTQKRDELMAQITRIDAMVTQLDRRWAESEKIFSYLQKHYGMNW